MTNGGETRTPVLTVHDSTAPDLTGTDLTVPVLSAPRLTDADCDRLFAPLLDWRHLLVAVSGGLDSSLLLLLLHQWTKRHADAPRLSAAVVDHALRPAAQAEAQGVCAMAQRLGLPAAHLVWQGEKPRTGLQAAARQARYRILGDHARLIGADALVLAHHADDQSETVLMRLCAGSGLDGLAGMKAVVRRDGLDLVRPLLGVTRQSLLATARVIGLDWIEDPSNANERFTRVRFRKARAFLEEAGLDALRLGRLGQRLARAQEALDSMAAQLWRDVAHHTASEVHLASSVFDAPDELQIRVLAKACALVAPDAPHRLERFEAMQLRLKTSFARTLRFKGSLAGCLVEMRDGQVVVCPEPPRQRGRLRVSDRQDETAL